jgi:flagellar hook-associated protein 2
MSGLTPTTSIDGLISGLNTTDLISKLMQVEAAPQTALKQQLATLNSRIAAYQAINTKVSSMNDAANALSTAAGWSVWAATSTVPTAATATATSTAVGGSLTFTINQLASAHSLVSSGTVNATTAVVATAPILLAKGGGAYGISTITGSGLTDGAHSLTVTQASAGATTTGTSAMAASTTISAANNTLTANLDGVATTLTIASGTYTQSQLAAAVQTASGGKLTATVTNSGALTLATVNEGSAHSLQITGGNGLAALGLSAGSSVSGTDGILKADNGATVTLNNVQAGTTTTLTSDTGGTIGVTLSGGLRVGTLAAKSLNVGDGSLDSVVSAINGAAMGVTASEVQVSAGVYKLQLNSTTAGATSTINVGANVFSGIGSMSTLTAAADAQLTVGSGAGAYNVTSSSNTVSNLVPGVTISLLTAGPQSVTININQDASGLADKVQAMVDATNAALSEMKTDTDYDSTSKKAGLLIGDSTVTNLMQQIKRNFTDSVSGNPLVSASSAGIKLSDDGTSFTFDKTAFLAAYASDPSSVQGLFEAKGSTTDTSISVVSSPSSKNLTAANWAVNVTALATQASDSGAIIGSGKLNPAETISLRMNGTTVSYTSANNDTLASIATGLNNAIAAAGLGLTVSTANGGNQLVVKSTAYGSASSFDVMSTKTGSGLVSTANTWQTHAGTDVAGTVNGVTFTGSGQLLTAPTSDTTLGGLILKVTSTTTGAHGTYSYNASVAQRLAASANQAIDPTTGNLSLLITGRQASVTTLNQEISDYDVRLQLRQQTLQAQFSNLETSLASLRDQGNYLTSQLSSGG